MIWALWSVDFPKEFQYLISCVPCVLTRTACWLSLSAINFFHSDPALCTGMELVSPGETASIVLYLCIFFIKEECIF